MPLPACRLTHGTGTPLTTHPEPEPSRPPRGDGLDARTLHIIEWFTCGTGPQLATVGSRQLPVRSCQSVLEQDVLTSLAAGGLARVSAIPRGRVNMTPVAIFLN